MARRIKLPRLRRREREQDAEVTPGAGGKGEATPTGASPPAAQSPPAAGPAAPAAGERAADPGAPAKPEESPKPGPPDGGEPEPRSRLARLRALRPRRPRIGRPGGLRTDRLRRLERPALIGGALLLAIGAGIAIGTVIADETGDPVRLPAVAPTVVIDEAPQPEAAEQIGFPAFATRNTTRVGGSDPVADAAGVALASYPALGGVGGPPMAVIAPADSWQAALAASSLAARPLGAPILLGEQAAIPGFTAEALSGLSPGGVKRADDTQLVTIGGVASPEELKTTAIDESEPARVAEMIDRQRARLSGRQDPDHIIVTTAQEPEYAMPAAAWAARSGDPIAFADGDQVPEATTQILERHPDARVYVLAPASVIGAKALEKLERTSGPAIRIGDEDPIVAAIEFARFVDGTFGWNINDPGHGFTIANLDRPADAGAGAPLAAGGKPGPMLLTDSSTEIPQELRNFLLDTKPGFSQDPVRAVYNHVWLLGDTSAISLEFQAQVDALTQLERVTRGSGVPDFGPAPGPPEAEVDPPGG